jgi:hypothetical protein
MDIYRNYPVYIPFLNSCMRFTLSAKARLDVRSVRSKYSRQDSEVNDWFAGHNIFFGLAVVRSGTTFLADFLNKNLADAIVQHEPNINDFLGYSNALQNEADSIVYINDYRLREIYNRAHTVPIKIYGEINPFLRRHSVALKQFCPQAKQFHLVRDGKDVVRSLMSRKFFTLKHPWAPLIYPPAGDIFLDGWKEFSRFEKICWLWKSDNEYLRKNVNHLVHFEKLISDYDYFKIFLTDYLEIGTIDPDIWRKSIGKAMNQTSAHTFPPYNKWEEKEKKIFEKICDEEMRILGY